MESVKGQGSPVAYVLEPNPEIIETLNSRGFITAVGNKVPLTDCDLVVLGSGWYRGSQASHILSAAYRADIYCLPFHLLVAWEITAENWRDNLAARDMDSLAEDLRETVRRYRLIPPPEVQTTTPPTILDEAASLTTGKRNEDYDHPYHNFKRTAAMWSEILGQEVTSYQVGLCMMAVKLARLSHSVQRDSLVDIAGYARTLEMVAEYAAENVRRSRESRE